MGLENGEPGGGWGGMKHFPQSMRAGSQTLSTHPHKAELEWPLTYNPSTQEAAGRDSQASRLSGPAEMIKSSFCEGLCHSK